MRQSASTCRPKTWPWQLSPTTEPDYASSCSRASLPRWFTTPRGMVPLDILAEDKEIEVWPLAINVERLGVVPAKELFDK